MPEGRRAGGTLQKLESGAVSGCREDGHDETRISEPATRLRGSSAQVRKDALSAAVFDEGQSLLCRPSVQKADFSLEYVLIERAQSQRDVFFAESRHVFQ